MTVHVVTGAPCSGKTTYVREHRAEGDPVVDFDAIAYAMGAEGTQDANRDGYALAAVARAAAIDRLVAAAPKRDCWIIACRPSESDRERFEEAGFEFVTCDPGIETCLERAQEDGRPEWTAAAIRRWYSDEKGADVLKYKEFEADVAEDGGHIRAYAATFDREADCYGDVIAKGAFTRTLKEWRDSGRPIPLLFGHNAENPYYNIGACYDFGEDERGLWIDGEFDADNETAQYARKLAKEKRVCKMSFAYAVRDAAPVKLEDGTEANELRDLDLFEVSIVTIPANAHADIIEVKDTQPEQKSGRRNSASDEQRIREAIAILSELLGEIDPEEQSEANAAAEEQSEANGAKSLLEMIEKIGGTEE